MASAGAVPTATMGSNPQILYTPQQQMGYGGYSVPCRVGNWAEDEYLGVLVTTAHTKKHAEGMLASQQLSAPYPSAAASGWSVSAGRVRAPTGAMAMSP